MAEIDSNVPRAQTERKKVGNMSFINMDDKAYAEKISKDLDISLGVEFTNATFRQEMDEVMRGAGAGSYSNQLQTFLVGTDRYQRSILPKNSVHSGLTFITRPRLNLQPSSLRQSRIFAPLDTMQPANIKFMIRCLLDPVFASGFGLQAAINSPLYNPYNAFFTPLCNAVTACSGWQDMMIQTLTTETGFHSEDQTFAIGYDQLSRTYDINMTFKDIQGGPIGAIFFYWLYYMHCVTKGIMIPYTDDVDNQRLNYTVSIYRFLLDPRRRTIVGYSKATGCFPVSYPIGAMYNFSNSEIFVESAGEFTIPFKANKIEYDDYAILQDFNILAKRYCPNIDDEKVCPTIPSDATNNYKGIPYIDYSGFEPRLVFKMPPGGKHVKNSLETRADRLSLFKEAGVTDEPTYDPSDPKLKLIKPGADIVKATSAKGAFLDNLNNFPPDPLSTRAAPGANSAKGAFLNNLGNFNPDTTSPLDKIVPPINP